MRILVTGIAGYIGTNFALRAVDKGYDVAGVDSFSEYYDPKIKRANAAFLDRSGVKVYGKDLAVDPLDDIVGGADCVVHLAGQPGISEKTPWADYNRNNTVATHRLLESSQRCGVDRFVNISSSSVYGIRAMDTEVAEPKPASWYGETKLAAELEVMGAFRLSGFPACSLRLFSVFGERERPEKLFPKLIRAIDEDSDFPLFEGSLDHQRSYSYVGDICEGILTTIENWDKAAGEIFNLGTDQCFTTRRAIQTVEEIMGKKARIAILPARPGDQKATHANIEKIRSRLGWEPKTSLREGLEKMVAWYRAEIRGKID